MSLHIKIVLNIMIETEYLHDFVDFWGCKARSHQGAQYHKL